MPQAPAVSTVRSSARTAQSFATSGTAMASFALAIIAALVIGVGIPGHLIVRHVVQTLPLWLVVWLGFRHSRLTNWVALPMFLFWFAIMGMVWLYLLGIAHIFSGHFTLLEKAMTLVVVLSSLAGIFFFGGTKSGLSAWKAGGWFVSCGALQWICFRISFLPAIAQNEPLMVHCWCAATRPESDLIEVRHESATCSDTSPAPA